MKKLLVAVSALILTANTAFAQSTIDINTLQLNTITTAVPFLIINPESRGGGMGDVGVATSADAASVHWNAAKVAFAQDKGALNLSYTPWLRKLVPDISLMYLSGYYKIDDMSAVTGSLRYFSLGSIQFTDQNGQDLIQFSPNEFAIDAAYARKLSDRFSAGIAARYINSNLTGGQVVGGANSKPGRTAAIDMSVYYENTDMVLADKEFELAWGLNVSNLGAKIQYTDATNRDFLPTNLRFGPRATLHIDDYNKITLGLDINKYLVPTPPEYSTDTNGAIITDANGDPVVFSGLNPDRPVVTAAISSFYDAPGTVAYDENGDPYIVSGSKFGEEMREFNIGVGAEYWYDNQFAARVGYFYEHITKGNRKYLTLGLGLKMNVFTIDMSYLIPTYFGKNAILSTSPLANTLRFSLGFNFSDTKGDSRTTD